MSEETRGIEMFIMCPFWQDEMIRAAMDMEMRYDTQS